MQAKHKNTGRWEGVKPRLSHFQVYLTAKKCGPGPRQTGHRPTGTGHRPTGPGPQAHMPQATGPQGHTERQKFRFPSHLPLPTPPKGPKFRWPSSLQRNFGPFGPSRNWPVLALKMPTVLDSIWTRSSHVLWQLVGRWTSDQLWRPASCPGTAASGRRQLNGQRDAERNVRSV
jgi:hypothetical protein